MSAHGRAIMQNVPQNNSTFTNTDGRTSPDLAPRTGPDAISPQEAAFDDAFRAVVDIALAKGLPNELALCETAAKIKQNLTTALAQVDPDQANRAETAIRAIVTSWVALDNPPSNGKWKFRMTKEKQSRQKQSRQKWAADAIFECSFMKSCVKEVLP
ncbi:unnamed protein product [Zymoseptoria tritici ST99CH_1E4]|uniref:Uncharacterized protein n=1 Tax=Zymoseptoria tritici ST99CH_1E4 TaxID=1276532 RepID=A0A2H1GCY4_ZYMTR|nr:unnamed protein product [Zymoseptoria tritici ST99CH_1E4]